MYIKFQATVEFIPKVKATVGGFVGSDVDLAGGEKRKQKKLMEDVAKGFVDKVKERGRNIDPNFWTDDDGAGLIVD